MSKKEIKWKVQEFFFFFIQQSWSFTLRPLDQIIEEGTLFRHNNVHFADRCDSFETGVMEATCVLLEEAIIASIM